MSGPPPRAEELRRIAQLAGLKVTDRELPEATRDIERILEFMAGISGAVIASPHSGAEPGGPPPIAIADDVVSPSSPRIDVTRLAPQVEHGLILCPPVPRQTTEPE